MLIVSLLAVLVLAYFAGQQHYFNPYEMWFLEDDPALVQYRQFTRQYGEEDIVIIAFRDEKGIFTNRALEAILDLTERLEATPLVEKVTSIANYQYIQARAGEKGDDALLIQDLVQRAELPLSPEELRRREAIAMKEAPIRGNLLSGGHDPAATAIVVNVDVTGENPTKVVDNIRTAIRAIESRYGYRMYLAGVPVAEHAFETFGRTETITFTSTLLAAIVILLGFVFRTVFGVVLPCAIVVLSLVSALGVMALLGIWLNPLTTIMPQIIITVGIAEAIHIVATYVGLRREGRAREPALVSSVEANFVPCLITSVTTAIGFASLVTSSLVPMREFGVGASIGTVFAFALTFTLLPAALAVWPEGRAPRPLPPRETRGRAAILDAAFASLTRLAIRRPWHVLIGVLVVFAAIIAFAVRLHVETSYPNLFHPETELRQGLAFIEGNLGGSENIEVSVDSGRSDGVKSPAFLARLAAIQEYLDSLPYVTHTFSIVDVLKRMNEVMHDDVAGTHRLPDSSELSAQYLLLYTLGSRNEDLKDRIDVDNRWTRLTTRVRAQSARDTQAMGAAIRAFIRERFPELNAVVTSRPLLYTTMQEHLAANTIISFLTAFVPITLVLAAFFRSVRMAGLSMVPNILPIAAMIGIMGLLRIPLDPGSAMVASVAIGIVVDDTVHFFSRYIGRRRAGDDAAASIRFAVTEVGRPVVYTTVILAAGFSLFSFSNFNFIAYFGQLAAAVIVLALLTDLLLTPALLIAVEGGRERAVGQVRGREPRHLLVVFLAVAIAAAGTTPQPSWAQSVEDRGLRIMRTQEELNRGYGSEVAVFNMTLINANKDRSERTFEMRTLEAQGDVGDKTLIVFKAPADIKGTALLTHQQREGDDDQWLYLPALRRTKRIASSNRSASFVGSEFSYEDLVPLELTKHRFRYLRDEVVAGAAVWVVESVPQKTSAYSRVERFVRQDNHQTVRAVFYDKKGEKAKVLSLDRWSKLNDRWWRARHITMDGVQSGKSTTLEVLDIRLRAGLSPRDFTTRALGD